MSPRPPRRWISETVAGGAGKRPVVHVRVPASSANLGPGFDAVGLALALYDDVTVRSTAGRDVTVEISGEGADRLPRDERHLVACTIRTGLEHLGAEVPGLHVTCTNRIPHSRGLGSSAAAIIAGLLAARALVPDGRCRLDDVALLQLAADMEGHPDNVAACLLGGLTLAWVDAGMVTAARFEPAAALSPVVYVPATRAATATVRQLLPATVPHVDAVANAARAALLVPALTTSPELLLAATVDQLHQCYRGPAMPATVELVAQLRAAGVAAVVSGAGPAVLALTSEPDRLPGPTAGWTVLRLAVERVGAVVSASGAVPDGRIAAAAGGTDAGSAS
jgi:homoserine kinase